MKSIDEWINTVNSNQKLVDNGKRLNLSFTFGYGNDDYLFEIKNGQILSINRRDLQTKSGIFKIHADIKSWQKHWLTIPPRDYHDIFAMLAKKIVTIDGNLIPLMQNLQYFKDIISSNRQTRTYQGLK